jgi:hypothetical protein
MKSLSNTFILVTVIFILGFSTNIIFGLPTNKIGGKKDRYLNLLPPVEGDDVNCPGIDYTNQTTGKLESPLFPENYAGSADCTYTITVPLGKRVSIIFDVFETEECCDFVSLYEKTFNDSVFIAKLSGTHSDGFIYTTNTANIMVVEFTSDANTNMQGFHAVYDAIDADDYGWTENQCSSNMTELFGVITNPNFPLNYPPNVDCTYLIGNGRENTYVELTIEKFNTEACCDHLRIYDGTNNTAELIMDMSGLQVPTTTYRTKLSPYMFMEFISDANGQYDGYSIKYEIIETAFNSVTTGPNFVNV